MIIIITRKHMYEGKTLKRGGGKPFMHIPTGGFAHWERHKSIVWGSWVCDAGWLEPHRRAKSQYVDSQTYLNRKNYWLQADYISFHCISANLCLQMQRLCPFHLFRVSRSLFLFITSAFGHFLWNATVSDRGPLLHVVSHNFFSTACCFHLFLTKIM